MSWVDKPGICEICGRQIIMKSARQKYCTECAEQMYKIYRVRNRDERNRREREYRAGKNPDWWKGKEHECKVKQSCIYGSDKYCEYLSIKGHSRILAGHPIKDGKCDLYEKGRRDRRFAVKLPEAPVLRPDKLGEV